MTEFVFLGLGIVFGGLGGFVGGWAGAAKSHGEIDRRDQVDRLQERHRAEIAAMRASSEGDRAASDQVAGSTR